MALVEIVAPTLATERAGNSVTAQRYAQLFGEIGLSTSVTGEPSGRGRVVVALNAFRTAAAITAAATSSAQVVVVLTGTDVYRFMATDRVVVMGSLDRSDRLVGLNDRVGECLEPHHRARLTIIHEGAHPVEVPRSAPSKEFVVAVVGHLRDEKDPTTVAAAMRLLPATSRIVARHYGGAHSAEWASWARREAASNERYRWQGEVPWREMGTVYAHSHVLVNSSVMEGGANAISEAVMAGLPVLATDIPGNVGVLGEHYPGYYTVGDHHALADLLLALECDPSQLAALEDRVMAMQPRFTVDRERRRWAELFAGLGL